MAAGIPLRTQTVRGLSTFKDTFMMSTEAKSSNVDLLAESDTLNSIALSGGGFRATLYHLGVLLFLIKNRLINENTTISGVSGGAIIAAHLGCRWYDYVFAKDSSQPVERLANENRKVCIDQLLSIVRKDLRNRVFRRLIIFYVLVVVLISNLLWFFVLLRLSLSVYLTWAFAIFEVVTLLIFAILVWFRRINWNQSRLLRTQYQSVLYFSREKYTSKAAKLPEMRPNVLLSTTSLTTGELVCFVGGGVTTFRRNGGANRTELPDYSVAKAVSCSSAFPPAFPPVKLVLPHEESTGNWRKHFLTDGGIYDNTGLCAILKHRGNTNRTLVSDAGQPLAHAIDKTFSSIFARNMRASGVLMDRASHGLPSLKGDEKPIFCRIDTEPHDSSLGGGVQLKVATLRTDLDRFADDEIYCLVKHGTECAASSFKQGPSWLVDKKFLEVEDSEIKYLCGLSGDPSKLREAFDKNHDSVDKNWFGRSTNLLLSVLFWFIARDPIGVLWLIPILYVSLCSYFLYDRYWPRCPRELVWEKFELTGGDSVLNAIAADVESLQPTEVGEYKAHIRISRPISQGSAGRPPSPFSFFVPHFIDNDGAANASVFLASLDVSSEKGGSEFPRYSYRQIDKMGSNDKGSEFFVGHPKSTDRLFIFVRVPQHVIERIAKIPEKLTNSEKMLLPEQIEVNCR